MATMVSGLGGPAGYGENTFSTTPKDVGSNDDGAIEVDISSVFESGIDFGGTNYTSIWINTNGVISFGAAQTDYTPALATTTTPLLAPFWADINIGAGGEIYWDIDPVTNTVIITWDGVAPYSGSGTNSFQVVLKDTGNGDFEATFIYGDIQWTDGGSGAAQTGFTDGTNETLFEGSGDPAILADYETNDFDGGAPNGINGISFVDGVENNFDDTVQGTAGADLIDSSYTDPDGEQIDANDNSAGTNADTVDAGAGDDTVKAGAGNDSVLGGDGNDSIFGDVGRDTLLGGAGNDTISGGGDTSGSTGIGDNSVGTTFTAINLGTFADIDPTESNGISENAASLLGTYGGVGSELYNNFETVTVNNTNGGTLLDDNDNGATPETFTIGGTTYSPDSTQVYNATVTFTDGTTGTFTAVVTQTTTGETYMMPEFTDNADNTLLTSKPIQSISLDSVDIDDTALNANRVNADYQVPNTDTDTFGDSINGGAGDDSIFGNAGADSLEGGTGNDTLFGGEGNDNIFGSAGNDSLLGEAGEDMLNSGGGNDTLSGGDGNDLLSGSIGSDTVFGDAGNDTINVAQGDSIVGGDGEDVFVLQDYSEAGSAAITIDGGTTVEAGGDTLDLNGLADRNTLSTTASVSDPDALDGTITMLDGTVITFSNIENIICFTEGTMILTPEGARPIDTLKQGDLVLTKDDGAQPIRWISTSTVSGEGKFAPIRLDPSVTGGKRALTVSPQHRILISDWRAQLYFEDTEVFVPAVQMLGYEGVETVPCPQVTYVHLLLDKHQVILAEGVETESFFYGEESVKALHPATRLELEAAFPELADDPESYGQTARRSLKGWESRALLDRILTPKAETTFAQAA